jgi:hypothetical protein
MRRGVSTTKSGRWQRSPPPSCSGLAPSKRGRPAPRAGKRKTSRIGGTPPTGNGHDEEPPGCCVRSRRKPPKTPRPDAPTRPHALEKRMRKRLGRPGDDHCGIHSENPASQGRQRSPRHPKRETRIPDGPNDQGEVPLPDRREACKGRNSARRPERQRKTAGLAAVTSNLLLGGSSATTGIQGTPDK